ncbi:oligosaccharide flippase family protein [Faecalimonas sp.]
MSNTSKKNTIIKGTFILTITGFLSRFIGFFYRIFLSRTFSEEGVGLYQLIFPIFALCFSLTAAGIEIAISRIVAQKQSLKKQSEALQTLYVGLTVSLFISFFTMLFLQKHAFFIAKNFLHDSRCTILLITLSYIFPFSSIHSCVCGYYLGFKRTRVPAISQLIEQCSRVAFVYFICFARTKHNMTPSISIAVLGLICGEICSSFYCIFYFHHNTTNTKVRHFHSPFYFSFFELSRLSIPLTANRILLNLLQSIEAISIPARLITYGLTNTDALATYGVLTGMALPCILFPSAITTSISTMLLPTIAEIQTQNDKTRLRMLIKKIGVYTFTLGFFCTFSFLLLGKLLGNTLFHSVLATKFILTLAWICPFLYTNNTLISSLNGLGKTTTTFFINVIGLLIRIVGILILIPIYSILGYLWGLIISQCAITILSILFLKRYLS